MIVTLMQDYAGVVGLYLQSIYLLDYYIIIMKKFFEALIKRMICDIDAIWNDLKSRIRPFDFS